MRTNLKTYVSVSMPNNTSGQVVFRYKNSIAIVSKLTRYAKPIYPTGKYCMYVHVMVFVKLIDHLTGNVETSVYLFIKKQRSYCGRMTITKVQ